MREHNMGLAHQEAAGAAAKSGKEKRKLQLVPNETPKLNPATRSELGRKFSMDLRRGELKPAQFEAFRLELTTERDRLASRLERMQDLEVELRSGIDQLDDQIQRFDEQTEDISRDEISRPRSALVETREMLASDLSSNVKHQERLRQLHQDIEEQIGRFDTPS